MSQNARWFSVLSKIGDEGRFISTVKEQFSDIQSISIEVEMGSPALFATQPWRKYKVPLYLLSDGLNKLVTVTLQIAHSEGTASFVDEIENGFHASRYRKLWSQLLDFTNAYKTQLFVSTHSWEFLRADPRS
jgi:predicted ATPase